MFSDEFMHFLINYQQNPEPPKNIREYKNFDMPRGAKKLAKVYVTVKQ